MLKRIAAVFAGRATPTRGDRIRLSVEPLEDRAVPANFTAANVAELIAAIDAANLTPEADQITLAAGPKLGTR